MPTTRRASKVLNSDTYQHVVYYDSVQDDFMPSGGAVDAATAANPAVTVAYQTENDSALAAIISSQITPRRSSRTRKYSYNDYSGATLGDSTVVANAAARTPDVSQQARSTRTSASRTPTSSSKVNQNTMVSAAASTPGSRGTRTTRSTARREEQQAAPVAAPVPPPSTPRTAVTGAKRRTRPVAASVSSAPFLADHDSDTEPETPTDGRPPKRSKRSLNFGSSTPSSSTSTTSSRRGSMNLLTDAYLDDGEYSDNGSVVSTGSTSRAPSTPGRSSSSRRRKYILMITALPPDTDNSVFAVQLQQRAAAVAAASAAAASASQPTQSDAMSDSETYSDYNASYSYSYPLTIGIPPSPVAPSTPGSFPSSASSSTPFSASHKSYEKQKRLPLKLRGKGTHGGPVNKVSAQVLVSLPASAGGSGSNEANEQQLVELAERQATSFSRLLTHKKARKFLRFEWIYSPVDYGFFKRNDFISCLEALGIGDQRSLTQQYWNEVRSTFEGKPRRFSKKFLMDERYKLHAYRLAVRMYYENERAKGGALLAEEQQKMFIFLEDFDVVYPLREGDRCLVYMYESACIHVGTIMSISHGKRENYFVRKFGIKLDHEEDNSARGVRYFTDDQVMPLCGMNLSLEHDRPLLSASYVAYAQKEVLSQGRERKARVFEATSLFSDAPAPYSSSSSGLTMMPFGPAATVRTAYDELEHAQHVAKLQEKNALLDYLAAMNQQAEQIKAQNPNGTLVLDKDFYLKYAYIIQQVKNITESMDPMFAHQAASPAPSQYRTPSRLDMALIAQYQYYQIALYNVPKTKAGVYRYLAFHASNYLMKPGEARYLFQQDRLAAARVVEDTRQYMIREIYYVHGEYPEDADGDAVMQNGSSSSAAATAAAVARQQSVLTNPNDPNAQPVLRTLSECVAYLAHLQRCIEYPTMSRQDVISCLDAAVLALYQTIESYRPSEALRSAFEQISAYANSLKELVTAS